MKAYRLSANNSLWVASTGPSWQPRLFICIDSGTSGWALGEYKTEKSFLCREYAEEEINFEWTYTKKPQVGDSFVHPNTGDVFYIVKDLSGGYALIDDDTDTITTVSYETPEALMATWPQLERA